MVTMPPSSLCIRASPSNFPRRLRRSDLYVVRSRLPLPFRLPSCCGIDSGPDPRGSSPDPSFPDPDEDGAPSLIASRSFQKAPVLHGRALLLHTLSALRLPEPTGICDGVSDIRWGCAGLAGDGEITGQVDCEKPVAFLQLAQNRTLIRSGAFKYSYT